MFPLAIPLISLAASIAPGIIGMFAGQKAGEMADSVVKAAKDIFGTTDQTTIQNKITADPSLKEQFAIQLNAEAERHKADLADISSAREQTVELAKASSPIAYGAPIVSVIIVCGYFLVMYNLFGVKADLPERTSQLLNILFGALQISVGQVCNYWLGSSAGSASKDVLLAASNPPQKTVTASATGTSATATARK